MNEKPARRSIRYTADEAWIYLRDAHTGILTTLRQDGVPISLPIWFAAIDGRIYVRTRGKKLSRIRRDSRASFLVEAGERWVDLSAVHFTGRAEIVEASRELLERFDEEMDRKYAAFRVQSTHGKDVAKAETAYIAQQSAMVCFTPDARILSWDNSRLGLG